MKEELYFNHILSLVKIEKSYIEYIFPLILCIFIAYMIIGIMNKNGKLLKYKKIESYLIIIIFSLGLIPPVSDGIYTFMIRNKVKDMLSQKITYESKIYVNGKHFVDTEFLLHELKRIKFVVAHNSSTTKKEFTVSIKYKDRTLNILLEQDNKRKKEYWAYTDYFSNHYEYIGRIINSDIEVIIEDKSNKTIKGNNLHF